MKRFSFGLAVEADDPALRQILRDNPMGGDISLSFLREPNYFQSLRAEGRSNQVVVVRDDEKGRIIGLGTRSIRPVYLNGKVSDVGYLSNLRLSPEYRSGQLLAKAYRHIRQLHQDGKAPVYLTTIMSDNHTALKVLTGGRAGLPVYYDWGEYVTSVIPAAGMKAAAGCDFMIVRGSPELLDDVVSFMHREGAAKQFFPFYTKEDLLSGEMTPCFRVEDLIILINDGRVAGVAGKWDQSGYKQTVVAGYGGKTRLLRPSYNLVAKAAGLPVLPKKGAALRYFSAAFLVTEKNDPRILRPLLNVLGREALNSGYPFFLVGLHSTDPLLEALSDYRCLRLKSRLFVVFFKQDEGFFRTIDSRIPYLELGTL